MTDTFRAMCAELVDIITAHANPDDAAVGYVAGILTRARAALAQPVAEWEPMPLPGDAEGLAEVYWAQPVAELQWPASVARGCYEAAAEAESGSPLQQLLVAAGDLLERGRPTPQPVAASERLPGPEDCLDEGWGWFFNEGIGWLPANALPTPEATNG